jgi:hypothetical protein
MFVGDYIVFVLLKTGDGIDDACLFCFRLDYSFIACSYARVFSDVGYKKDVDSFESDWGVIDGAFAFVDDISTYNDRWCMGEDR